MVSQSARKRYRWKYAIWYLASTSTGRISLDHIKIINVHSTNFVFRQWIHRHSFYSHTFTSTTSLFHPLKRQTMISDRLRAKLRAAADLVEKRHKDSQLLDSAAEERLPKFDGDGTYWFNRNYFHRMWNYLLLHWSLVKAFIFGLLNAYTYFIIVDQVCHPCNGWHLLTSICVVLDICTGFVQWL